MLKTAAKLVNPSASAQKNEAPLWRLEKQNRKLNRGLFNKVETDVLKSRSNFFGKSSRILRLLFVYKRRGVHFAGDCGREIIVVIFLFKRGRSKLKHSMRFLKNDG